MHGKKIISNSAISLVYKVVMIVLGFVTRGLFIHYLGEELLGLSTLYATLLDLLNLADLGLGVALMFQLYEPLVRGDVEKQSRILTAARKIYSFIGLFILAAGIILSFFIQHLIKENPYPIWYVRLSFLITLSGVAMGYFFAHLRLYMQANEEIGLVNIVDLIAKLITVALSIVSLVLFRQYFLYLAINALYAVLSNTFIFVLFRKRHREVSSRMPDCRGEARTLTANLKNVVPMKLSNYVYNSTDNLIISKILGLATVTLYGNYMTVINGIMGIEYLIGNAVTASLGKMLREEEKSKVYRFYLVYQYAQFLFSAFCTVGIAVVSKSFITWWVGERFLIDKVCLVLLVVDFFVHSMYQPAYVMFGAAGKFRDDKIITLASAVMNIVISIGLVFVIGLPGVIVGTLVTDLYIWGVRSYQVVRSFFGENLGRYAGKMVKYILLTALGMVISMKISSLVQMESLLGTIAIHVLICVAVPNAVSLLGTLGSEEFRFLYGIAGKALRRKRGNL